MKWDFFSRKKETPASLRRKAEEIIMQADVLKQKARNNFLPGEHDMNRSGKSSEFRQYREYVPSDRPQDIDWKRSGRSDQILVREREAKNQNPLKLFIPNTASLNFTSSAKFPTKYESCAVLALAFAVYAEKSHDPVYFNHETVKGNYLGTLLIDPIKSLSRKITSSSDSVIILSDFLDIDENLEDLSLFLNSRRVVLLHCYDPAELTLPYNGRVNFSSFNGNNIVIEDVAAIRKEYKARISSHQEKLENYAGARGWLYRKFDTSENLSAVFIDAELYLEERR